MKDKKLPDDAKKLLDRELFRMRFGSWSTLGWIAALGLLLVLLIVRIPVDTRFAFAEVTGVIALASDDGPRQKIGVMLEGRNLTAGTRASLLHPAKGETVCVRQTTYWPLGGQVISLTDLRFCDGTMLPAKVD